MTKFLRAILCWMFCLGLLLSMAAPFARAEEVPPKATELGGMLFLKGYTGFDTPYHLFDRKLDTGTEVNTGISLTFHFYGGLGSLYFVFGSDVQPYTVTDHATGISVTCGEYGFLHDFVDLQQLFGTAPTSITVDFGENLASIQELYIYTPGEVPDFVQKWQLPADNSTDLLLYSTHGDDEQLFFAGLLPYYAGELGYQVQVAYFTDHRNNDPIRQHEMLNGLWAVGVRNYPVFGHHTDFRVETKEETYDILAADGFTKEDMLGFVVEQMRRFKPLVVIAHDFAGEYGHPQHMIYADLVAEALEISNDAAYYPELAEKYGLWDVPKAYFHLYEENQIVMDWDQPLESFGGMTAFEVTKNLGFPQHASQLYNCIWYYGYSTRATDIQAYSPCLYGLYRSTVGEDVLKNDFFENVPTHAEIEAIAEAERLEQERLAEQARLEEEARLAEEKRIEEEQAAAATQATEAEPSEPKKMEDKPIAGNAAVLAVGLIILLTFVILIRRKKK